MIELTFSKPKSLNALIDEARGSLAVAAGSKEKATKKAALECREQSQAKLIIPVYLVAEVTYSTETSDIDNLDACLKPILDGLVKCQFLKDDNIKSIYPFKYSFYTKTKRSNQYVTLRFFFDKPSFLEFIQANLLS